MKNKKENLVATGRRVRRLIVDMAHRSKTAEMGSSLSISDIVTVLYSEIININPKKPEDPKRDRFVLSKGHGAAALYAILAIRGFFPLKHLDGYRVDNGTLHCHPSKDSAPGLDVSTGSLGHGLSIAAGMAIVLEKTNQKIYVLIGDGECNEGSVWEACMFIATHNLKNIVAIIDDNKFQGFGETKKVHTMDLARKWSAFGWNVLKAEGHNPDDLIKKFKIAGKSKKPTVIIANTVAGKGVRHVENTLHAHYYIPDDKIHKESQVSN